MSGAPKRAKRLRTARSQSAGVAHVARDRDERPAAERAAVSRAAPRSGRDGDARPGADSRRPPARPIPDAPPLTSATLPAKLQVMSAMVPVTPVPLALAPGRRPSQCLAM